MEGGRSRATASPPVCPRSARGAPGSVAWPPLPWFPGQKAGRPTASAAPRRTVLPGAPCAHSRPLGPRGPSARLPLQYGRPS
eukprot:7955470-Alexandrium_andersonii.AAC.1